MHRTRSRAWLGALSLGLLLASTTAARAQQAIVTGRVTDEAAGQPVSDVQVVVVGTTLGALTNQDGRYTIRGVPAGAQQVRAIRIGYTESKKPVTVGEAMENGAENSRYGRSSVFRVPFSENRCMPSVPITK